MYMHSSHPRVIMIHAVLEHLRNKKKRSMKELLQQGAWLEK